MKDHPLASVPDARHHSAIAALREGRLDYARAVLRKLLAGQPDDPVAWGVLGAVESRAGNIEAAEQSLKRAVALAPDDVSARLTLAQHYLDGKRSALVLEQLAALPETARHGEPARLLEADALGELGRLEEQLAILRELAAGGDPVRYNNRIGLALRGLGRSDEAAAAFRSVLAVAPADGLSWWNLANLKSASLSDEDVAAMEAALATPSMPVENALRIHFALGKALEDRKQAEAAFRHYDTGNRLRASLTPYDPAPLDQWLGRCKERFTAAFYGEHAGAGSNRGDPIFILGMQRSGSTLVEQVLASHPLVEGTDELTVLINLVRETSERAAEAGKSLEQALDEASPADLATLGETYLERSAVYRHSDRPRFTDKMPTNWMYACVIPLILPKAHIIDIRREPMDCCVSNWKQLYARGLDHSNDLGTMGHYYATYVDLMRHLDAVRPGTVHRVIYEDLIDDFEGEVRRLLDHLGLPFDPACLEFYANRRAVRTISADQVRKPVNRDGIGRWRLFEPWLDPLKAALGPVLTDWRR